MKTTLRWLAGSQSLRLLLLSASAAMLAACGQQATMCADGRCTFEHGEAGDPVVRMAQALVASSTDTLTISVTNGTKGYNLKQGLVTFKPLFTVGQVMPAAVMDYVSQTGKYAGDAKKLAAALGLTLGVDAFEVPDMSKGKTVTVSLTAPTTAKISYIARVDSSTDDFAAALDVPLTSGAPGAVKVNLAGYDPNDGAKGVVVVGNGTTGALVSTGGFAVANASDCPGGAMSASAKLFSDDFSKGANDFAWPATVGYEGDFNGDWMTDGVNARFLNPVSGGSVGVTLPTTSGFVRFISACPAAGSQLSVSAAVTAQLTDPRSDTTLVVYFFDRAGSLLEIKTSFSMRDASVGTLALYDAAIPASARRIAVVPVALFEAKETGTVYYDDLSVDYAPANAVVTTLVATDDFSSFGASAFGANQPTGWTDYGGDFYVHPTFGFATLWNASWSGGVAGADTGMMKSFDLTGKYVAGDKLSVRLFAATTFTDPTSFVRLRVLFDTGAAELSSDRVGRGWNNLDIRRAAIPAGVKKITVVVNAVLGPKETSSLYFDNLSVVTVR